MDVGGNIYISDTGSFRIRRLGVDGIITTFAGNGESDGSGDGGPALLASLNYPTHLAITCTALYVSDKDRIRAITLTAPLIAQNGVVDAAGLPSVHAGATFSISGCNLASSSADADPTSPLPFSLAGTSVTLNGNLVPIASVNPTRITAQVPAGLPSGNIELIVTANDTRTAPVTVNLSN